MLCPCTGIGKKRTCFTAESVSVYLDIGEISAEKKYNSVESFVSRKDIASSAENSVFNGILIDISEEFRADVALMDMKHRTLFSDKVRLIYLQLPYFTKEADECENVFERIIYVLKHMDRDFKKLHLNWCVEQKWTEKNFKDNTTVQIYLMKHPEMKEKTIKEICLAAGGEKLYDNIKSRYRKHALIFPYQEAKLNKDNRVYPSLGKCTEDEIKREFYKTEAYEKHRVFADKYYS